MFRRPSMLSTALMSLLALSSIPLSSTRKPPKYPSQRDAYPVGAWLGDGIASTVPTKADRNARRLARGGPLYPPNYRSGARKPLF